RRSRSRPKSSARACAAPRRKRPSALSSRSASPTSRSSEEEVLAMSLALKLVLSPLLFAQAREARRRAPPLPEALGPREGQLGSGGTALRLLIAGDSSAAGVGVMHQDEAFAGHFTRALHKRSGRPLRWRLRAKSGLTTREVHRLLQAD